MVYYGLFIYPEVSNALYKSKPPKFLTQCDNQLYKLSFDIWGLGIFSLNALYRLDTGHLVKCSKGILSTLVV